MPQPVKGEKKETFLARCMSDLESINSHPEEAQRFAVCSHTWETHTREALSNYKKTFAKQKVSFDYDDTLSTKKGFNLASQLMRNGDTLYVISARNDKEPMLTRTRELGIPDSRVYATGSNKAKVEKVLELGIDTHYDNNSDIVNELGKNGKLFK